MGERAAYRVKYGEEISPMMRKQWFVGDTHDELESFIYNVAEVLMYDPYGIRHNEIAKIGDGMIALRDDLNIDRLTAAMFKAIYSPPFDGIYYPAELNCDIGDHGIYEIELIEWNKWHLNHYDVDWDEKSGSTFGKFTKLATITFTEGESLSNGMQILFHDKDM